MTLDQIELYFYLAGKDRVEEMRRQALENAYALGAVMTGQRPQ